jgi:hypothetical protein
MDPEQVVASEPVVSESAPESVAPAEPVVSEPVVSESAPESVAPAEPVVATPPKVSFANPLASNFKSNFANFISSIQEARHNQNVAKLQEEFKKQSLAVSKLPLPPVHKNMRLSNLKATYNQKIVTLKNQHNARKKPTVPKRANKKGLFIGTNYVNTPYTLHGCVNDPNDLKAKLVSYGFTTDELLTDNTAMKPTAAHIMGEIAKFLQNSVANDILFLSFSGHGSYTADTTGTEANGQQEMIISTDLHGITDIQMKALLTQYLKPGVSLFVVFDSCFSGTMLDLKYQYFDADNNNNTTVFTNDTLTASQVVLLSGCTDTQTSAENYIAGKYQGALTWAFIQSLNGNNTYAGLLSSVRSLLSANGYTQTPQLSAGLPLNVNDKMFIFN